jgi:hypothetical protein
LPCEAIVPASRNASRPSGPRADAEPAEVLVVEDDMLAAGADQIRVVRVDAVVDDPDLDARPVDDLRAAGTFMTSRASGSISGCAGLEGQICCGPLVAGEST